MAKAPEIFGGVQRHLISADVRPLTHFVELAIT